MSKIWKLKEKISVKQAPKYEKFGAFLGQLLYNRELEEESEIKDFLSPEYTKLPDPFLFQDMNKAAERIWKAVEAGEKMVIYGDYDADAVTANAVLRQTFKLLGADVTSYIPDRFSEGYGVNLEALKKIKNQGAKVIITVDCGTNSVEAAQFCKESGIDFIITDHHEIIGALPAAFALINPKNDFDNYPHREITGVGVAFKLACAILKNPKSEILNPKLKPGAEKWLLDLVAIGTVADCHSLLGENRILVKYGLKVLEKTRWVGLRALIKSAGLLAEGTPSNPKGVLAWKKAPDTYTLGFVIAPRLNAAGRLEHADIALDLLLEEHLDDAKVKAEKLEKINSRRQEATQRILSEAKERALLLSDRKVLVIMSDDWHKGVVGLVAGRLAEDFYKPTIVLQAEGEEATGSARTVGNFNVVEALKYASDHLVRFGGHKQAAGLTLRTENFEIFYQTILEYAEKQEGEPAGPILELEAELTAEDLTLQTFELVSALEPFGVGNPRPKFLIRNARVISQRQVGGEGKHLQMQIEVGETSISAIAFNFRPMEGSEIFDVACELIQDGWNGRRQLKLRVVDVRINQDTK